MRIVAPMKTSFEYEMIVLSQSLSLQRSNPTSMRDERESMIWMRRWLILIKFQTAFELFSDCIVEASRLSFNVACDRSELCLSESCCNMLYNEYSKENSE